MATTSLFSTVISAFILEEQFGFLHQWNIHDAVVVVHEFFHLVKKVDSKEVILKLDFSNAYDMASWTFLRLVFIQLGIGINIVNWIMKCV